MRKGKYILDLNDLQYKVIKLPWRRKFLHLFFWLSGTILISFIYGTVFENIFGSPKEMKLQQEVENMKLQFSLTGRQFDNSMIIINSLKLSDDSRYRPVLNMEIIPESFRNPGFGGIERFRDLNGYINSDLMKSYRIRVEEIRNMVKVQEESFNTIGEKANEWIREMEYLPRISPVNVIFRRGDGLTFREIHPIFGTSRWHHGQDFSTPYGTEVFATGSGKVIAAGWNDGGFGNYVVIDHGYGFQTTYGHLSSIKVSKGTDIKRGDLVGLSGSSGSSLGPHLHYQIDLYGRHENPLYYFSDDLTEDEYFEMIQTLSSKTKFR
ncbi:MAG: M23 family metallopeptidase [Bacteroidales bacterium]|nr:M23 family metallopeptidase [Bacteroidales bacterium]